MDKTKGTSTRGKRVPRNVIEFGHLLRQLREYYGLSQHELARRSGVPHHTIHRLEAGQIPKPGFDDIARLARYLNLDLNMMGILLGLWEPEEPNRHTDPELQRQLAALRDLAQQLSPEEQHQLVLQLRPLVTYWSREGEQRELPEWLLKRLSRPRQPQEEPHPSNEVEGEGRLG